LWARSCVRRCGKGRCFMSEAESTAEARRWMSFAQEDLEAAEGVAAQWNAAPRHACWLAQQAVEKALKAILVYLQIDFPKSHDLDVLRHRIPDDWMVKLEHPDLAELTEWAVEARYPGDWPVADKEDARDAVVQARAVCESVRSDFMERGVSV